MSEKNPFNESVAGNNHSKQIVVFKLGKEEYGLFIDQIKEVVITPNITRMPQMPSYVRGVANIRGNIIAMLDLEEKFELSRNTNAINTNNHYTLVIESSEYKMGVLVREVPNTLSISAANIESTIFTGDQQSEQSYVTAIVKLEKRIIIMIDIFKVISPPESQHLFRKQNLQEA